MITVASMYIMCGFVNAFNNIYILVDSATTDCSIDENLSLINIVVMLVLMVLWPADLIIKVVIMSNLVESLEAEIKELESALYN